MSQMRVLIVATSEARLADSKTPTGAWAEEIAVPYYVFRQKGYVVELASPRGQAIPLDPRSITAEVQHRCPDVRRFLADGEATSALQSSTSIVFACHTVYNAIYVAGGANPAAFIILDCIAMPGCHGIMWDGAVNKELTSLLESALNCDAIVATCGHGAVALLEVKTKHNATVDYFVKNKEVTAPTRPDELAAGVAEYIPFQLPEELKKRGAVYSHADTIDAPWAVRSGRLVTGQNFNAAKKVAELVVEEETCGVRVTP